LIFKNQAMAARDKPQGQFVNDLLRTEFHKCVLSASFPTLRSYLNIVAENLCRNLSR
jgi:hypothetical protein